MCEVVDRSAHNPAVSDDTGNNVSPSAATAPLVLAISTPPPSSPSAAARPPWPRTTIAAPPLSHHAVSVRQASSVNVLIRWTDRNIARAKLALSATS